MRYLTGPPEKGLTVIDDYLVERIKILKGEDQKALLLEFKEWIMEKDIDGDNIWTIPDLTDDGLRDFFKRAISRKYS